MVDVLEEVVGVLIRFAVVKLVAAALVGRVARAVPVVKLAGVDDEHRVALVLDVGVEAEELLVPDDGKVGGDRVELVDLEVGVVFGVVADEVRDQLVPGDVIATACGGGRDPESGRRCRRRPC